MDPLSVLRDYTMRSDLDSIRRVGDEYHFRDEYRFPCNIETAYRSKQGSLYTLESLVFFVKNTQMKHTDYMQQSRALKLQTVTFIDRKALLDYLEGRVQTADAIELLAPTSAVTSVAASSHHHLHIDQGFPHPEDDVEEYRPDDPTFVPSKRSKLEDGAVGELSSGVECEAKEIDVAQIMSFIKEREKPIRNRNSILLCHNKDFQEILTMLTKRDDERRRSEEHQDHMDKQPGGSRYSNTDGEERGMDAHKQQHQKKDVIGGKVKLEGGRSSQMHHNRSAQASWSGGPTSGAPKGIKADSGPPIILVPSAFQTMLNMYNAKEFLEDGTYVAADVKAKELMKKPEVVTFLRKMGRDTPVKYEVRDKPSALSPKDWERVVAVFVLGKEWQFKDWPFKDHVEIFSKIMGIYLRFEDDSVESAKNVKQWNVKIISLSKHKRHQDRTAVLQFWDSLESFIRARRLSIVF